ncbi:hypothetical protein AB0M57_31495 [Streptomyces sp. NPDC051597]|uniref:hypothetical protein n=1 Tax=Streptomyces sp. NPDC051597 TaxID=3155049 RepID=UPI00341B5712
MVKLGEERIHTRGSQVYGYQVMSTFLRHGNWDNRFLGDYGNALIATEKKMKLPAHYWNGGLPAVPKLNFIGEDFGRDPMTGFMTALAASPGAATEFFTPPSPPTTPSTCSVTARPSTTPPSTARKATGAALVAAATGVDPNDVTALPEDLTPEHRKVLDLSLQYLSARGDDFPPEMRDDMATILSAHSDVVHHSASSLSADEGDARLLDRGQLLEVSKQLEKLRIQLARVRGLCHQRRLHCRGVIRAPQRAGPGPHTGPLALEREDRLSRLPIRLFQG